MVQLIAGQPVKTASRIQERAGHALFVKLLFDLFPVILFFIAFKLQGIYVATAVAIAATFAQIGWAWWRHRKVDAVLWVSLAVIVVFGGATLLLHDETFIKWKPTVLYWLFAATLAGAQALGKNLIQAMLGSRITLPDGVWTRLNLSWIGFFLAMGGINLFVAYTFSTESWVSFKVFGAMGLLLLFALAQGLMLAKYVQEEESSG